MQKIKSPFPYFGGKSLIANKVWQLLGNPEHYLEPFAGSLAVLLARPNGLNMPAKFDETVNDLDCNIANVWRSLKYAAEKTAHYTVDIVSHVDLNAKRYYIRNNRAGLLEKMNTDPEYYDCKLAGYYIWCASYWIGAGYNVPSSIPKISIPHNMINISTHAKTLAMFEKLRDRLRHVRIVNGDWMQILGGNWQGTTWKTVGIYLATHPTQTLQTETKGYILSTV